MSKIKFGPAGLGSVKEAISNLEEYSRLGFEACEIAFTYGAYIEKEDAKRIGKVAKKLGIFLSIHASYFINLNSEEPEKIEASKKRILKCCEIGHYLGAKRIIFHPGFYSGMNSREASIKIKESILELREVIKQNGWDVELCPEIMGKKNVFGSIEEISDLVKDAGCSFCIDFAHIYARNGGRNEFEKIRENFPEKKWHCHFSGIEYGEKGERKHLVTPIEEWKKVLDFLKELDKDVVLICESPKPVEDSIVGKKIWEEIR
ncbi:MAG: TIM barrel protein [archaeon]